jgi:hypothetical protein
MSLCVSVTSVFTSSSDKKWCPVSVPSVSGSDAYGAKSGLCGVSSKTVKQRWWISAVVRALVWDLALSYRGKTCYMSGRALRIRTCLQFLQRSDAAHWIDGDDSRHAFRMHRRGLLSLLHFRGCNSETSVDRTMKLHIKVRESVIECVQFSSHRCLGLYIRKHEGITFRHMLKSFFRNGDELHSHLTKQLKRSRWSGHKMVQNKAVEPAFLGSIKLSGGWRILLWLWHRSHLPRSFTVQLA